MFDFLSAIPVVGPAMSGIANELFGQYDKRQDRLHAEDWNQKVMKNSIQWKVQDAKAAGIHPLAAMGAMTHAPSTRGVGRYEVGKGGGSLIQAQKELLNAQRDYYLAQANSIKNKGPNKYQLGPEFMSGLEGQQQAAKPRVITRPHERITHDKGVVPGSVAMENVAANKDGGYSFLISESAAESLESDTFANVQRFIENAARRGADLLQVLFGINVRDRKVFMSELNRQKKHIEASMRRDGVLPKGYEARYNLSKGRWYPYRRSGKSYLVAGMPEYFDRPATRRSGIRSGRGSGRATAYWDDYVFGNRKSNQKFIPKEFYEID